MKSVNLNYDEIGSVCLVDKEEFDKFWSQLHKFGISVKSKRLTKRAPDARKSAPKKRSKTRKGSAKPARR